MSALHKESRVRPTKAEALRWLDIWGDQISSRQIHEITFDKGCVKRIPAAPFMGNIDAGRFRPIDDPHPQEFVFLQVEKCLNSFATKEDKRKGITPVAWLLAEHMFVNNHGYRTFRNPSLVGQRQVLRLRTEIIERLQNHMAREKCWDLDWTISEKLAQSLRNQSLRKPSANWDALVVYRALEKKNKTHWDELYRNDEERRKWLRSKKLKTAYTFLGSK